MTTTKIFVQMNPENAHLHLCISIFISVRCAPVALGVAT